MLGSRIFGRGLRPMYPNDYSLRVAAADADSDLPKQPTTCSGILAAKQECVAISFAPLRAPGQYVVRTHVLDPATGFYCVNNNDAKQPDFSETLLPAEVVLPVSPHALLLFEVFQTGTTAIAWGYLRPRPHIASSAPTAVGFPGVNLSATEQPRYGEANQTVTPLRIRLFGVSLVSDAERAQHAASTGAGGAAPPPDVFILWRRRQRPLATLLPPIMEVSPPALVTVPARRFVCPGPSQGTLQYTFDRAHDPRTTITVLGPIAEYIKLPTDIIVTTQSQPSVNHNANSLSTGGADEDDITDAESARDKADESKLQCSCSTAHADSARPTMTAEAELSRGSCFRPQSAPCIIPWAPSCGLPTVSCGVSATAWSPNGLLLAVATSASMAIEKNGKESHTHILRVYYVAANPTHSWEVTARKPFHHAGVIGDISWSADSRWLLSGSQDGTACMWRLPAAATLTATPASASARTTGPTLQLCGRDECVDCCAPCFVPRTRLLHIPLSGCTRPVSVQAVRFHPAGMSLSVLVTGGSDGALRLWCAAPSRTAGIAAHSSRSALALEDANGCTSPGTMLGIIQHSRVATDQGLAIRPLAAASTAVGAPSSDAVNVPETRVHQLPPLNLSTSSRLSTTPSESRRRTTETIQRRRLSWATDNEPGSFAVDQQSRTDGTCANLAGRDISALSPLDAAPGAAVTAIDFSFNGSMFSADSSGTITVWHWSDPMNPSAYHAHRILRLRGLVGHSIRSLCVSPRQDSSCLVLTGGGVGRVVDTEVGAIVATMSSVSQESGTRPAALRAVSYSPDGELIVAVPECGGKGGHGGRLLAWNAHSGTEVEGETASTTATAARATTSLGSVKSSMSWNPRAHVVAVTTSSSSSSEIGSCCSTLLFAAQGSNIC